MKTIKIFPQQGGGIAPRTPNCILVVDYWQDDAPTATAESQYWFSPADAELYKSRANDGGFAWDLDVISKKTLYVYLPAHTSYMWNGGEMVVVGTDSAPTIDKTLSSTSRNPLENRAINALIATINSTLGEHGDAIRELQNEDYPLEMVFVDYWKDTVPLATAADLLWYETSARKLWKSYADDIGGQTVYSWEEETPRSDRLYISIPQRLAYYWGMDLDGSTVVTRMIPLGTNLTVTAGGNVVNINDYVLNMAHRHSWEDIVNKPNYVSHITVGNGKAVFHYANGDVFIADFQPIVSRVTDLEHWRGGSEGAEQAISDLQSEVESLKEEKQDVFIRFSEIVEGVTVEMISVLPQDGHTYDLVLAKDLNMLLLKDGTPVTQNGAVLQDQQGNTVYTYKYYHGWNGIPGILDRMKIDIYGDFLYMTDGQALTIYHWHGDAATGGYLPTGAKVTVDSVLSSVSVNPVENRVITRHIYDIEAILRNKLPIYDLYMKDSTWEGGNWQTGLYWYDTGDSLLYLCTGVDDETGEPNFEEVRQHGLMYDVEVNEYYIYDHNESNSGERMLHEKDFNSLNTALQGRASTADLAAEIAARQNADTAINSVLAGKAETADLTAEITARQNADTAINGRIGHDEDRITELEKSLPVYNLRLMADDSSDIQSWNAGDYWYNPSDDTLYVCTATTPSFDEVTRPGIMYDADTCAFYIYDVQGDNCGLRFADESDLRRVDGVLDAHTSRLNALEELKEAATVNFWRSDTPAASQVQTGDYWWNTSSLTLSRAYVADGSVTWEPVALRKNTAYMVTPSAGRGVYVYDPLNVNKLYKVADVTNVVVDTILSATSENPVQNKVITAAIRAKADANDLVDVDMRVGYLEENTTYMVDYWGTAASSPTAGQYRYDTSAKKLYVYTQAGTWAEVPLQEGSLYVDKTGGLIYRWDGADMARLGSKITVDSALDATSENPVQNKVIKAALDGITGAVTVAYWQTTAPIATNAGLYWWNSSSLKLSRSVDNGGLISWEEAALKSNTAYMVTASAAKGLYVYDALNVNKMVRVADLTDLTAVNAAISDLQASVARKAEQGEVDDLDDAVQVLQSQITTKAAQSDLVALQTAVSGKASQTDLTALTGHVNANDSRIATLEGIDHTRYYSCVITPKFWGDIADRPAAGWAVGDYLYDTGSWVLRKCTAISPLTFTPVAGGRMVILNPNDGKLYEIDNSDDEVMLRLLDADDLTALNTADTALTNRLTPLERINANTTRIYDAKWWGETSGSRTWAVGEYWWNDEDQWLCICTKASPSPQFAQVMSPGIVHYTSGDGEQYWAYDGNGSNEKLATSYDVDATNSRVAKLEETLPTYPVKTMGSTSGLTWRVGEYWYDGESIAINRCTKASPNPTFEEVPGAWYYMTYSGRTYLVEYGQGIKMLLDPEYIEPWEDGSGITFAQGTSGEKILSMYHKHSASDLRSEPNYMTGVTVGNGKITHHFVNGNTVVADLSDMMKNAAVNVLYWQSSTPGLGKASGVYWWDKTNKKLYHAVREDWEEKAHWEEVLVSQTAVYATQASDSRGVYVYNPNNSDRMVKVADLMAGRVAELETELADVRADCGLAIEPKLWGNSSSAVDDWREGDYWVDTSSSPHTLKVSNGSGFDVVAGTRLVYQDSETSLWIFRATYTPLKIAEF